MRILSGKSWGCSKQTLLKIYRVIIRPVLVYGVTAMQHEPSELQKLNQIQYKALMIACGAFKGTALSALQVHCGEKPLALYRKELMIKYSARLKINNQKGNVQLLDYHWTDAKIKGKSLKNNVKQWWESNTINQMESRFFNNQAPWVKAKPIIILKYDANQNDVIRNNNLSIFTDASKKHNKAAIGIAIHNRLVPETIEIAVRLNDGISITRAELFSIYYGLLIVIDTYKPGKITVYSDCLDALRTVAHKQYDHWANQITTLCMENQTEVTLQ